MNIVAQYHTFLLILILQDTTGLWSSGHRQQFHQQECCKTDNHIGLVPPKPPSYESYRYEAFQNYPRIYQSYHSKYNQYSDNHRRYLPAKQPSYSKDYYRKVQSHIPSYTHRRVDHGFADDHFKRPYTKTENGFNFRNTHMNYRPYFDKTDSEYNDREVLRDPNYRDKYSPGLLLSSVADRSGTLIVTDPDGIKHRIHSISLKELDLPENDKPFYIAPDSNDPGKDAIKNPKPSPPGLPEDLKIDSPKDPYNKNDNTYMFHEVAEGYNNSSFIPSIQMQNNGQVSSSAIRFPSGNTIPHDFHPSPPFHKYSEPDPLFHPNGSPLQTHVPLFITSAPNTATAFPTPRRMPSYPDSINEQIPPTNNEDTFVPYVKDQVYDAKSFSATQAIEATQRKLSAIEIAPTKSSSFSTPGNETISSTTQRLTSEDEQKKWDFLPTVQEVSSSPTPKVLNDNGFNTSSLESTTLTTETPESKILPSVSKLDKNHIVSSSAADIFDNVRSNYELKQDAITEAQLLAERNINTTITHSFDPKTTTSSVQLEVQTEKYSTASFMDPAITALEDSENVTKLEEFYFDAMSTIALHEESATTATPDTTHSY